MPPKKAVKLSKKRKQDKNEAFVERFSQNLDKYERFLICNVDNVSSRHFQKIRMALKGHGIVVMGKNTLIRRVLREKAEKNDHFDVLLHYIRGNVGFIFSDDPIPFLTKKTKELFEFVDAKIGVMSPVDVMVEPGPTGLDPGQTAFFQAVNIQTKITRGQIEIISPVHLVKKGVKVGPNEASLLTKLGIKPFSYGFDVMCAVDHGVVYDADCLEITDEDIVAKMMRGIQDLVGFSLDVGLPFEASVQFSLMNGLRQALSIGLEIDYKCDLVTKVKESIESASKVAAAAPKVEEKKPEAKIEEKKEAKKEEKKKEEKKEEPDPSDDFAFDLFG